MSVSDIAARFRLDGRVAIVTGGSRGLGREMAIAFADAGADVVVASRKLPACEELADEIRSRTGRRALGAEYHAGRWADSDRLIGLVDAELGGCDILINNAGMSPLYDSLTGVSEDLFDKVLDVNLRGPFRLSTLAGARMVARGRGSIVNISSIAAVQPSARELVYAAAKAALNTMTVGLARALAPEVRVNAIMPGPFLTDIARSWDMASFERSARQTIPLQRAGEPDEVVGAALYLASDASSYTTGAVIKIDGGAAYSPA